MELPFRLGTAGQGNNLSSLTGNLAQCLSS